MESNASDLLTMHRLACRADGGAGVVRWLADRTGCWVGLLDRAGAVLVGDRAALDGSALPELARAAKDMAGRGLRAFSTVDGRQRTIVLVRVDVPDRAAPVLAVVGAQPVSQELTGGAAAVVGTSWWAERTRRTRQRLEVVDAHTREAVLHMLMSGQVSPARRIASMLRSPLPDRIRLHVIECPPDHRDIVHEYCGRWRRGGMFVVPCPVHRRHVIVIASADAMISEQACPATAVIERFPGCLVGTSDIVALSDTCVAYEQAFHALSVARGRTDRRSRFDSTLDPATVLVAADAGATAWAHAQLAPLTGYVRARTADPDADELMATLRSWLSLSTGAARQLKIHRNTLRARLERIEELVGIDLGRTDHQATLALALRITAIPRSPASGARGADLHDLVQLPVLTQWANTLLRPVQSAANGAMFEHTLREWLAADARLSAAAAALGISVPGVRKRLQRLEQLLHRSLLHAPHARYDIWLAFRAADACSASEVAVGPAQAGHRGTTRHAPPQLAEAN